MMNNNPRKSGLEDEPKDAWPKPCLDPQHQPPGHMVIPAGKIYRHVCPACGVEVILRRTITYLKAETLEAQGTDDIFGAIAGVIEKSSTGLNDVIKLKKLRKA